jgi:hypothetical protein
VFLKTDSQAISNDDTIERLMGDIKMLMAEPN